VRRQIIVVAIFLGLCVIQAGFQSALASSSNPPPEPEAREFSITPNSIAPGNSVSVKWTVERAPNGSPLKRIRIVALSYQVFYDSDKIRFSDNNRVSGTCSISVGPNVPAPSEVRVELKIDTQDGRTYSKYASFNLVSIAAIKRSLSAAGVTAQTVAVNGSSTIVDLDVRIQNSSSARLGNVELKVVESDPLAAKGSGIVLAYQSGQILRPGLNTYRLRIPAFHAAAGKSVSVVVLYGTTVPRQELAVFPVTFDNSSP
jgi:hypothetical protein